MVWEPNKLIRTAIFLAGMPRHGGRQEERAATVFRSGRIVQSATFHFPVKDYDVSEGTWTRIDF
eukprot:scaffold26981_cov80-Skeletonema_marinoi.AAC.4